VIEIRSYRRVFDLERRIYSVDRLRLNPGGVPVRGVVYFLAIVLGGLIAGGMPFIGALVAKLPWYLRYVGLPVAGAAVLSAIRIEGRVFHLAAQALVRYWVGPRRLAGGRACRAPGRLWHPPELVILPDGSDARMRRMRYTGPGAVLVCVEHSRDGRVLERGATGVARWGGRRAVTLTQLVPPCASDRAQVISLGRGARLCVRRARAEEAAR
jgi:hypothetical protein